jgi:hypothetical protein
LKCLQVTVLKIEIQRWTIRVEIQKISEKYERRKKRKKSQNPHTHKPRMGHPAEDLRAKNVELKKALSPRIISVRSFGGGKTTIDSLKAFSGMEVLLVSTTDEEARRAAASTIGDRMESNDRSSGFNGLQFRWSFNLSPAFSRRRRAFSVHPRATCPYADTH